MKILIFFAFLFFSTVSKSWSQISKTVVDRKKVITELPSGLYEIREYSKDSIPLYKGTLASVDPEVREGKFYFMETNGRIMAVGHYKDDLPSGLWSYYDSTMNVVTIIDCDRVWTYFEHEAHDFGVDSVALSKLSKKDKATMNEDGTFYEVDKMPTFKEGDPSVTFMDYLNKNIHYPAFADVTDFEDLVDIEFTIDTKGMVRDPQLIRSSIPDLNVEAMRVLIESPAWEPGLQRKTPVNVRVSCRIIFKDENLPDRYYIVEEMPRFMGMDPTESFRKFISSNLQYPEEAAEAGYSGMVIIQFTVMPDGSVNEISVVSGAHPLLDAEAVRVVNISPQWTPGKQRGKNVAVVFTYPISFVLGH